MINIIINNNCKTKMYPFIVSHTTVDSCIRGANTSKRYSGTDCRGYNDCLWMCLPCSFVVDIIICLPMTGIYIYNKCNDSDDNQPEKNNVIDKKEKEKDCKKEKEKTNQIISSAPTALENPNNYEIK
jgi:hypothetical protein